MKRLVATSLLVGYVMLVPFCFFGGMLMANAETMNMIGSASSQMDDCGMSIGGCAHSTGAGGMDASHHVGMYNSITQTPLTVFSMMLATLILAVLVVFGFVRNLLSTPFSHVSLRPRMRRADEPRSTIRTSILTWLSLFETSPNFA